MANNRVQVKRTSTTGRTPNTTGSYATNSQYISAGELALNMTDGILYTSDGTNLITVGSNLANQRITNSLTIDNNKNLRFTTVNTSAVVSFIQQNDDNFVMYSTNTAYGQRAIWSVYANSISNLQIQVPLQLNAGLVANGGLGSAGQVLTTNGTTTYWSTVSGGAGSVNTAAQYTWTNLHTFSANVSFTGNGIGLTTNTAAIYLGGLADNNWKIGRNTGSTTKWRYTNNSIDIITANSNLEGFAIGLISGNSYFETGYLGTFIAANVTIGNSSSNSTINSTSFSGTASNATNLNSQPGSYYTNATNITTGTLPYAQIPANIVNTTGSFTLSGNTTLAGTNTVISSNVNITGTFINVASAFIVNSTGAYHTGTMNAASHTVGTAFTANATVVNAVSYYAGTTLIGNTTGPYGKTEINLNVNSALTANNSTNLGGTAAASYQLNSTLNANIASYLPTYTGVVNGSSYTVGTSFTANSTLVNAAAINITGQVNTATLFVTTSANIASSNIVANTAGVFVANSTGVVNASTIRVGTSFTANATLTNTVSLLVSTNTSTFGTAAYIVSNGNVGVATSTPGFNLEVNGAFAATTKSFVIDHPTKPGMKLRYVSLEGPENGVYVRGKLDGIKVIELPDYWEGLVDLNTITVQLTAIGHSQNLYVAAIDGLKIHIDTENHTQPYCYYTVYGERKDVDKLIGEY